MRVLPGIEKLNFIGLACAHAVGIAYIHLYVHKKDATFSLNLVTVRLGFVFQ